MPSICRTPVITGTTPTTSDHSSNFVVTLEPIATGKVGRAAVAGTVAFRLESSSTSHKFATVKDSSTLSAKSAGSGLLRILARSTVGASGWVWAVGVLDIAGDGGLRLCKTSAAFNKGSTATLNVWEAGTPPSETQTSGATVADVVNKFANIASGKFVSVAMHGNGRWYVVAAEC
jgi:hypothetical protein